MSTRTMSRRIAFIAGGTAVLAMTTLSACTSTETPKPSQTSVAPSQSESVTPSPTEKAIGTNGPNSFTPTVNPAPPGAVCTKVVGNNCIR